MTKQMMVLGAVLAAMPVVSAAQESARDQLNHVVEANKAPVVDVPVAGAIVEVRDSRAHSWDAAHVAVRLSAAEVEKFRAIQFYTIESGRRILEVRDGMKGEITHQFWGGKGDVIMLFRKELSTKLNGMPKHETSNILINSEGAVTAFVSLEKAAPTGNEARDIVAREVAAWMRYQIPSQQDGIFKKLNRAIKHAAGSLSD